MGAALPRLEEGQTFGRLTVIEYVGKRGHDWSVRVLCECGETKRVQVSSLRAGLTRSCGCLRREASRVRQIVHGEAPYHERGRRASVEYQTWAGIKQRCTNPNTGNFKWYGGRGIKMCPKWLDSFPAFLADVGRRPTPAHSIDRIDNDGDYEPDNVRWATPREQANNRRPKNRLN